MLLSYEPNNAGRSAENLNKRLLIHTDIKAKTLRVNVCVTEQNKIKRKVQKSQKSKCKLHRNGWMEFFFNSHPLKSIVLDLSAFVSSLRKGE